MVFNKDYFMKIRADMYNFYFINLDNTKFASLEREIYKINSIIPENGNIIFYTNLSEDVFFVYSKDNFKKIKFQNLKPIKNLIYYQKKNMLTEYLDKINFKKVKIDNSYLLAVSNYNDDISKDFNDLNRHDFHK